MKVYGRAPILPHTFPHILHLSPHSASTIVKTDLRGAVKKEKKVVVLDPLGGLGSGNNFWSKTTTFCFCFSPTQKPPKCVKTHKKKQF